MTVSLSDHARAIIDAPVLATVATLNPDGSPQLTVVWAHTDGEAVVFSTVRGRRKSENLEADPRIGVSWINPDDPMDTVEVRGTVELVDDPDGRLIDELCRKYRGTAWTEPNPGSRRVIARITPTRVRAGGH
ncbi:PPOX class F420-dependent oxidoreductase [Tsukamurella sp. 8F]|uniref:PPOX class F420-dependent oxidoreductase n=1 Tax=unclassified Tsukamurella TaxID=2633480 RepID=UPI0023BA003B|nr:MULTISPECIES: PPOX class F420-dependent oxidoreductase [unclassified Tsukamurella]MDF0529651.1 PPOX class F420-dependent oxidoreductase [Tsukamurella sp. 8J]MDF0585936.1 PPOX class F420-dependent oxidoreductase [Tsukamurella sp. 8F]